MPIQRFFRIYQIFGKFYRIWLGPDYSMKMLDWIRIAKISDLFNTTGYPTGKTYSDHLRFCCATSTPQKLLKRVRIRGEHGQDQDWISCRILAIFLDQDWILILIFEKNWIRTGSGYWFDSIRKFS